MIMTQYVVKKSVVYIFALVCSVQFTMQFLFEQDYATGNLSAYKKL